MGTELLSAEAANADKQEAGFISHHVLPVPVEQWQKQKDNGKHR